MYYVLCVLSNALWAQAGRAVASAVFGGMTALQVSDTTRQGFAVSVCIAWASVGLYVGHTAGRNAEQ